ncbi:ABC-type multidrug transport system ATPase subunit [Kitasatospora sp. MAP12-15]|uniref:FHA domain-containing protein n=1 Tax=unclassified Kitasatospora TaxID=2633591 RepID=UPI002474AB14|nr:FHA domain-containing protein [Kitasatospora sp. MAP12-44]MDH6113509.1 ABC-type multidrug transport system ATPase subunit [Kitasatospora sp. MAP12-44]
MPQLVLELNGQYRTLEPGQSYTIGRDPQSDFPFDDPRISWRHATISFEGAGWQLQDHGSTNGCFVGGARTQQAQLLPGTVVNLGNAENGPRLGFSAPAAAAAPVAPVPTPAAGWHEAQTDRQAAAPGWDQPAPPVQQHQPAPPVQQQWDNGRQQPWAQPPQANPPFPHQQSPAPMSAQGPGERNPTVVRNLTAGMRIVRIGRALDNDVVVSDLQVSRHHAELHQLPDGRYEIVDLGSHNGIFVNGQPTRRQLLGPQDRLTVGHSSFQLVGDQLQEFIDNGPVSFSAHHLTVEVDFKGGKKVLLNDVSFGVPEKSLVAVIGPSGSGKSTLLRALTGYRPADRGEVLYDGRNLYKQFAELRQRIGLVPQSEILHKELTVRTGLKYAARLRFPGDTEPAERARRIDEVLYELRLDKRADNRITALSGGQQKRVSVALELLTKPSLIFLDEPTSGLDPGMDREVMQMLRGLADDGRTILVVTHSVAELALCDRLLVMAPGGSVAYFGPPAEALHFFGYETWADVFQAFENYPDHDWAGRYRGSEHYKAYSADVDAVTAVQSAPIVQEQIQPPKPQSWGSQLWTLMRRYMSVLAADRGFLALSVLLPAVLGGVSTVIPDSFGLGPNTNPQGFNGQAGTILLILAIGACFSGAANSVRELIKERAIYERERATGLSRSAYLVSKIVVLGLFSILQGAIIAVIGFAPRTLPEHGLIFANAPAVEMAIGLILLSFTSMMFGLVISALVKTSEKTMPLLVMFAIIQVVFTGVLFQIFSKPGLEQFAWLMPARWGVGVVGTTLNLSHLMVPFDHDPLHPQNDHRDAMWSHSVLHWAINAGALVVISVGLAFLVLRLLRRHEPEVMQQG